MDQDHALEMREAINNLNTDITAQYSQYVCRITDADGDYGRANLEEFKDIESKVPTIVTTSQLLTTGVDIPTCRNIVLVRAIGSMVEFKQIIG